MSISFVFDDTFFVNLDYDTSVLTSESIDDLILPDRFPICMLFTGWEVRMVEKRDRDR